MKNTDKIIALYKYVKELCALKYTVVTDIDKQYWTCFLRDIPNDSENITIYYRDTVEEDETSDNMVLLEVRKPEFQRCPQPPAIIIRWLEPGWDRFTNTPVLKQTLVDSGNASADAEALEHFEDSKERLKRSKSGLLFGIGGQRSSASLTKHVASLRISIRHTLIFNVNLKLLSSWSEMV